MKNEEIQLLVFECIKSYLEAHEIGHDINGHTALFGSNAIFDSMGLVNVIIDIESKFLDEDIEISLTSEKAMSRRNSPFRTISTLAEFIEEQIKEGKTYE
ncbi:MAG: hypothetical protein KAT68_18025 [Bacteroidales bacterium]|nr:hypothetical protein [Bacteroidales bacterium]